MKNNSVINQVAVVVIGRNEGERLYHCFQSLIKHTKKIVYVDSGSTDDSIQLAKSLNLQVISLDLSIPFTAARARNIGLSTVVAVYPEVKYIQFVDGDCQVYNDWITTAIIPFEDNEKLAVVCGRRKEIYPEISIYNYLCDVEWNTPIGESKACGGDALMRVEALKEVSGYREDLIAGEEPELCVRLRAKNWKILRIDQDMTKHDANLMHFSQWWKRTMRSGYAYAQGAFIHGAKPERHWFAELKRAIVWGGIIPIIILILCFFNIQFIFLCLIYVFQIIKITLKSNLPFKKAIFHAFFLTLGKFPEFLGALKFYWHRICKLQGNLIEYK